MHAIVVERIGSFAYRRVDDPVPRPGDVVVRVEVAGLCRTDLKVIEAGHRDLVLPRVPAEEAVGVVEAAGSPEDASWVGRRVYVYPGTACGACRPCLQGAQNLCTRMRIMGFHRDGGFAEKVLSPAGSLIALPSNLPFEDAVLIEPLSCALNALELARVQAGETLFIWGAGPAGSLLHRAARSMGVESVLIEPDEGRRLRAGALPHPPAGRLCDAAVVAVGSAEAYAEALACLDFRGRLVVFSGLAPGPGAAFPVDLNRVHYREHTVVGAYGCGYGHGVKALDLIAGGDVAVSDLVTHRFPLNQLRLALNLMKNRQALKILLYPQAREIPHA